MMRASRMTWWAVSDTVASGARRTTHDSPSRSTRNISQLPPPRIGATVTSAGSPVTSPSHAVKRGTSKSVTT